MNASLLSPMKRRSDFLNQFYCYAECHYAESHYAECHYVECHYAECHYTECHYVSLMPFHFWPEVVSTTS
jgi:hypothetical protein